MPTTRAALTDDDIRTLVKGATADERAVVAHKLCRHIGQGELAPEDREKAYEILRNGLRQFLIFVFDVIFSFLNFYFQKAACFDMAI